MDFSLIVFFVLSALLVLAALTVVFVRNVVHAAVALVGALLIIAIFFFSLQAPMLGALQVLVYAGAIMVLFLFVIMFLNPGALERASRAWWALGTVLALLLGVSLAPLVSRIGPAREPLAAMDLFGSPELLARSLFTDYVIAFEVAAVLLLVAIIGAVVLAKREP